MLATATDTRFAPLIEYAGKDARHVRVAGSAAVVVIQGDRIAAEWYARARDGARFNVYSVRKTYIGLAALTALPGQLDTPISQFLTDWDPELLAGTTIRHLLTHTHGLVPLGDGKLRRSFTPGTSWDYAGSDMAMDLLCDIIRLVTGQTVSKLLAERVFNPLGFHSTGWCTRENSALLFDVETSGGEPVLKLGDGSGRGSSLYVSARELAYWGYLHLKQGRLGDRQILTPELFQTATSHLSPPLPDLSLPQMGAGWWYKAYEASRSELGEQVPPGSYQVLGFSGCLCLVLPAYDAVVVRMHNVRGSAPGYDYFRDVRDFGNLAVKLLSE